MRFQKTRDWIVRGFVLAIFVVHPLIIMPDTYYSIVDTKRIFFTVVLVATCALLLGLTLVTETTVSGLAGWPGWKKIWRHVRPYEYALLAYFLVMVLATIFNAQYKDAAIFGSNVNNEGLLMQTAYLLTAVAVGRLYKPREWDLFALCASATVVSVIGIFQYYGMDFLHLFPVEKEGYLPVGHRITFLSTMSNRNIVSTYLCLAFCVCVVLFSQYKKKIHWAYLPMAWIIFYTLIIGDSESGYVGIAAAMLLLFPFVAKTAKCAARFFALFAGCSFSLWLIARAFASREWAFFFSPIQPLFLPVTAGLLAVAALLFFVPLPRLPQKLYRIGWYVLLVIIVVVGIAFLPAIAEKTQNPTLYQAAEILDGNIDDSFGTGRVFVWRHAMQLVPDHAILGHGPDQFYPNFLTAYGEKAALFSGENFTKAHNEYVQFLVDTGALGLLCMLAFYALVFWRARKGVDQPMTMAVILTMTCFLVQAFFNFSTPLAHPVVWTLWGVLAASQIAIPSQIEE